MLFQPGQVFISPGAHRLLEKNEVFPRELLTRHLAGDFGMLCDADKALNTEAIHNGARILSAYEIESEKMYVITEWDRSYTTILLASEY